ncbi:MAG: 30S ribosomal protein S6 [Flavobacteriales bacterium]|jgi:small subunit ribosomal protein S6|nr:30S ribosomal protein S6 [Flavobacteriales bacterium]MDG1238765.1 30S ribosomal protein S6 [Flavobacteriales bacterium]MDG1439232.1 30S ribosomal protein S6 [Flavobacteriales bacterium]MDG1798643.1 30S ribosomal protein S6 [Flavobacteriales bacterium]
MNHYETVFILTPVLSEKQTKEAVDKFKKSLKDSSAKINNQESWGLKKLAYPIQKKSTGFYFLIEFQGEGDAVKNFELELKRDERVMRFLTMKMDKDHLEYSVKRRNKFSKTA